jgi:hypothetical protein
MMLRVAAVLAALMASSAAAEEWQPEKFPPVMLVRAAVTSSLSRNGDPRRPLDSIKLGTGVYYFVEAKGFVAGPQYPIFLRVFDPSNREARADVLRTRLHRPQDKVSMWISGGTLDRPGLWTFRMYVGEKRDDPSTRLLAETKIEVSPTGGSSAATEIEGFAPLLVSALAVLLVYLAYNTFVVARAGAAAIAPRPRDFPHACDPALLTLVAVNLAPLAAVHYLDANAIDLLFLYWVETVVVGFYGVLRLAFARGSEATRAWLFALIPLFVVHFGAFTALYGAILFEMFGHKTSLFLFDPYSRYGFASGKGLWEIVPFAFAAQGVLVFAAHGIAFVQNYLKGGEYRHATFLGEQQRPYRRIGVMHATLILGGAVTSANNSPLGMLVVLVLVKTAIDVYVHIRAAPRTPLESP